MKIIVGSKNPVKINAVKETITAYEFLKNAIVEGKEVPTSVSDQPKSLDETVKGAMHRAKEAHKLGCDLSVGLEDDLMKVPHTKTEYLAVDICCIYDGKQFHIGMGSAFEYPKKIIEHTIKENTNISIAAKKTGFTTEEYLGYEEGMIGILTKGRLNRKEYTKEAVRMALIHLEFPEFY